ncbi:CHAT domain-containing protein [Terriglobus aquaticus]|uniref:CHAT domain-containing tetratricopeptide repeat protein n=1 Tax=Terriglobus aquaticus TaxID=940139 RepID=A0ABW9KP41_9BACT
MLRSWARNLLVVSGVVIAVLAGGYAYIVTPHHSSAPPESASGLLDRADTLAWGNRWADAKPVYKKAEEAFQREHRLDLALYARVSQIPADETGSVEGKILQLTDDLARPEAQNPETHLRILTIRGMLETNYDAGSARSTWQEVQKLALKTGQVQLATRAVGEQGIAAFLLGDTTTAKKQVVRAWGLSKVERDTAATVRYASVFGAGLVQVHDYKEALTFLDQAIKLANSNPALAYPTIAIYAKIDALSGLKNYHDALSLANASLERIENTPYEEHKAQVLISRGSIFGETGNWKAAIADYKRARSIGIATSNYRDITDAGGKLAQALERTDDLTEALAAINSAIEANTHIPDELYLVPRNLVIKAEITEKMGKATEAESLYREAIASVDIMLTHADTTNTQRYLLSEMSDVYSGFFTFLSNRHRYNEALQVVEHIRGRVEAEALEHHASQPPHIPTPEEKKLTALNISLIATDDPGKREAILNSIRSAELAISPSAIAQEAMTHPVTLTALQRTLQPSAVVIEYVLAEPASHALVITSNTATPYLLPAKSVIEADAVRYRKEIRGRKDDRTLGQQLFNELLKPIPEYSIKTDLVVIPDGSLHLLPFSALVDESGTYVLKTHTVAVAPSSTVYEQLEQRVKGREATNMPYLGVAAWTQQSSQRNPVVRAFLGPTRSELVPLPDSQKEVETIGQELPQPGTILLGSAATETKFKEISSTSTDVVHLALHGYADLDYPDRSALAFAPEPDHTNDGLLQVREIRDLKLNVKLVTLSACDTGVGPVGEVGVANLVNAFIEAGADSVVSTLWELEDHTTEHLMAAFYGKLATGAPKVDALRSAQLELLDSGLPPYFWASFQVVGDAHGNI